MYWFENAGDPVAWIGSADMMHRNLDRRVEVLVRLPGEESREAIRELLDLAFDGDTSAWVLRSDGGWVRNRGHRPSPGAADRAAGAGGARRSSGRGR